MNEKSLLIKDKQYIYAFIIKRYEENTRCKFFLKCCKKFFKLIKIFNLRFRKNIFNDNPKQLTNKLLIFFRLNY